jgi:DNA-binding NarL/FixJ family response regulator
LVESLRRAGMPVVAVVGRPAPVAAPTRELGVTAVTGEVGVAADLLLLVRGPLTIAEAQVLRLAADGYTNNRIAHELGISVSAVKARLESAFLRLGAADRAHAVAIALRERWIR